MDTARKIFCGHRPGLTRVDIQGFARPSCADPAVQNEWQADFDYASQATDGEDVTPGLRRGILETRRMLNEVTGRRLTVADLSTLTMADIPHCGASAAGPTPEEARLHAPRAAGAATMAVQILARSGLSDFMPSFFQAVARAGSLRGLRAIAREEGERLWRRGRGTQSGTAAPEDRALYWARLQGTRALRQLAPRFRISDVDRQTVIEAFERASRGMTTATFTGRQQKRIVVSGFDPFGLTGSGGAGGNPSGAAALALDGRTLTAAGVTAEVQSAVFPVRFADFDAGLIESFFGPFLSGPRPADMIMTISQGGSADFEVEQFAGRRRSSAFGDNLGTAGTTGAPSVPTGLASGPEFLETTLPTGALRGALGRGAPLTGETEITETTSTGTTTHSRGPTAGATAVAGSGGGFLSNEIFYRASLLRQASGRTVPVGHLHTPFLEVPAAASSAQFELSRTRIVQEVERLVIAALPSL